MPDFPRHLQPVRTRRRRVFALAFAGLCAIAAAGILAQAGLNTGFGVWDGARVALIAITTAWLAWGAAGAFLGLRSLGPVPEPETTDGTASPTVILVPICNENPVEVRARISAMRQSLRQAGVVADFAILSDTSSPDALQAERLALAPLFEDNTSEINVFYRNRTDRHGRKAGNVEDFIAKSGGAYEYAVILDADSLMEGETIKHLIARMDAAPDLGLLQTLPKIVGARSLFGRAMQFSASFHSPVFSRGLARLQGHAGPFWGHNAIARVRALAQCCGLPVLSGPPPFGGTILSHDYVEAALLVRGGWRVEMDPRIEGSFEEGPDNLLAFARRDRRWCQGNLQHMRLLAAPGLHGWSRFVFVQGIMSYLVSVFWAAFLLVSLLAAATAASPNYFPDAYQLFPVFPDDRTKEIVGLAIGVVVLLILPKLTILAEAIFVRRAESFGSALRSFGSVAGETLLTAVIAPIMLMYQTRAVAEVFSGKDGGWPATARGEGRLTLAEGWRAGQWISIFGLAVTAVTFWTAPDLILWLLPVTVPMIVAPLLITVTSWPASSGKFTVPHDLIEAPVVRAYRANLHANTPEPEVPHDPAIQSA